MNQEIESLEQAPLAQLPKAEFDDVSSGNVLPTLQQLHELYELELSTQDTPPIRLAQPGETPNTYLQIREPQTPDGAITDTETVRKKYISRSESIPWWLDLQNMIKQDSIDSEDSGKVHIMAKHTADIVVDGEKQDDQSFEVFEIGEKRADKQSLETVFETLRLLDQFSGGLLAADPDRPKVILGNDIHFGKNHGGDEFKGLATSDYVFINMASIADSAEQNHVDPQEILAVVMIHEMLGHSLDGLVAGKVGKYFGDRFDYSDEHVHGDLFEEVHESIVPKDKSKEGSHTVREYGSLDSAEDLATSVDTTVSEALGLDKTTSKVATMESEQDSYRKELVMGLMDKAAQQAAQYKNTPGIVGSELRYVYDDDDKLKGVEPARKLEIKTVSGEAAVQEEVSKVIDKDKFPKELIVGVGYDTGV